MTEKATRLSELLDLPERVHKGDFVLNLSRGVTEPEKTLADYVVTPQLEACFKDALGFVRSAVESRSSKATYLHGSFGSGKSHFMAVLYLLLQRNEVALRKPELASLAVESEWVADKKFLLVPYHMIAKTNMESAILGGYADFVAGTHPGASRPGVYLAEELFEDARSHRENVGDEKFFEILNRSEAADDKWGRLAASWTPETFEEALAGEPGSEAHSRLVGDLVEKMFTAYRSLAENRDSGFLPLDKGLSVISRHAHELGYDGIILFLDELILWLASHAGNRSFVQQEGQKLAKLVESQTPDRPVPIISFVARQRDLRELVGEGLTGADELNFADALKHWEGRFHMIKLEDRNLPTIAEKRVLRPKNEACKAELDQAFEETARMREEVFEVLLTREGERDMFRQVYPFSPALVQTLVAVSGALQRERTALKIMLQLLVAKRDSLELGEVVPVGDLWDQVAHGEEAFTEGMSRGLQSARRLYRGKLLPLLEQEHGVDLDRDHERAKSDPTVRDRLSRFEKDDRLVKTLLLAALVPEVEPLKGLTPARLAALNHGTIRAPIAGTEGQIVLGKLQTWSGQVGEIRFSDDATNPTVSLQLSDVDVEGIIDQAKHFDNKGTRKRKIRSLLFEAMGVEDRDQATLEHKFQWRGTRRTCDVVFTNVRALTRDVLANDADAPWKLIVDFPFDEEGFSPRDDLETLRKFGEEEDARALVWLPAFFSRKTQKDLGTSVILDQLLRGENLHQYSKHLSPQDRMTAETILRSRRTNLQRSLRDALEQAYAIRQPGPGVLDESYDLGPEDQFRSLWPSFTPRAPVAASLREALDGFLAQALENRYPAHPVFDREVKTSELRKVWGVLQDANRSQEARFLVDKPLRPLLRQLANPLDLGTMAETHFVKNDRWSVHFNKMLARSDRAVATVGDLRSWTDEPRPMGLPTNVQDVLILQYADQENCSFRLHGGPVTPEIDKLDDAMELHRTELPDQAEWTLASKAAAEILGVTVSPLASASSLDQLASEVEKTLSPLARDCRDLPGLVQDGLKRLGADNDAITEAARFRTAGCGKKLAESLLGSRPLDVVRILAATEAETSPTALGRSLKSAPAVRQTLEGMEWGLFEGLFRLRDERKSDADVVIADVLEALRADEYHLALPSELTRLKKRAIELLTLPEETAAVESPPPSDAGEVVHEKHEAGLDSGQWQRVSEEIHRALEKDESLRLTLSWKLHRGPGGGDS